MKRQMMQMLLAIMALGILGLGTGCMSTPKAGEIGVVRNGGPFDNKNIRGCDGIDANGVPKSEKSDCGIVNNGAGNTGTGLGSTVHYYPVDTQQRFFKMESCQGDRGVVPCDGADAVAVTVPSADGVEMTLSGTFYLNTVFNNSDAGMNAVRAFDTQFSTREFQGKHPYDGTEGWSNFLTGIVSPIVSNNLRDIVAGVNCAQLVSSCSLVQNQSGGGSPVKLSAANNRKNISDIQRQIEAGLAADLKSTLGGHEFFNSKTIQFKLSSVSLPGKVQDSVNDALASFGEVSKSQAKVQQAVADAKANEERQKGYSACPSCANIDLVKAIPDNVTTFAPGNSVFGAVRGDK